jgi:hypothetical protein
MSVDTQWEYEFSVWPAERGFSRAVYKLFEFLNTRVVMEFTENDFNLFRDALNNHGITLREIERRPYVRSERVL